ncbi:MAG: HAMP domain-containing histidine kinase [Legionellaceae bacterium]|nr:HAMP domain-containing histidine kinase [Legionellaceae bacterium]
MKHKPVSIKNIFIRKMAYSAILQMLVLAIFLLLSQKYVSSYQNSELTNILIINDSFSLDEITKYVLLKNQNALDLALLNISQERKLDNIKFISPENIRLFKAKCVNIKSDRRLCRNENNFFSGITSIKNNNKLLGFIVASKQYNSFFSLPTTHGLIFIIIIVFVIYIFNSIFLLLSMRKIIARDTKFLIEFIQTLPKDHSFDLSLIRIEEYKKIARKFISEHRQILLLQRDTLYSETKKEISEQVAHDIRSPIAAINTIVSTLNNIPEKKINLIKNSVKRINDIANNLLLNSKDPKYDVSSQVITRPELMYSLLANLIIEKKYEYHNSDINITLDVSQNAYKCFATINDIQFNRILSNIINNSIDAINRSGSVKILLRADSEFVYINIEDDGCGIPADVLPKIMDRGFSFNKTHGTGLGLFYTDQYIKQLNGIIDIYSKENVGTRITITLPRTKMI